MLGKWDANTRDARAAARREDIRRDSFMETTSANGAVPLRAHRNGTERASPLMWH